MTDEKEQISRKDFLKIAGAISFMVSFGFTSRLIGDEVDFIRPPGAVPPEHFLSLCLKCERCLQVCPTTVIQDAKLQDNLVSARTPILDFKRGYCNFCLKCIEVCPTGALSQAEFDRSPILGIAEIDPVACIAWSWRGCGLCVPKCPAEAIRLDEADRPVVIAEKCNGCGICENVCPRAALRSYDINHTKGVVVKPYTEAL